MDIDYEKVSEAIVFRYMVRIMSRLVPYEWDDLYDMYDFNIWDRLNRLMLWGVYNLSVQKNGNFKVISCRVVERDDRVTGLSTYPLVINLSKDYFNIWRDVGRHYELSDDDLEKLGEVFDHCGYRIVTDGTLEDARSWFWFNNKWFWFDRCDYIAYCYKRLRED